MEYNESDSVDLLLSEVNKEQNPEFFLEDLNNDNKNM